MVFIPIIGAIIGILGVVYIYLKHVSFKYWSSRGVAQVEPVVPIGNIWPILVGKKSVGELTQDMYSEFKNRRIVGFYSMTKPSLLIAEPDLIRFVLTKEFACFHDRGMFSDEKIDPLSGNLFLVPGAKWKNLRVKLSPTFTSGKMKYMFGTVAGCADNLAQYIAEETEKSDLIEINEVLAGFSTDVISSTAFGIDFNSIRNPETEFREQGRKFFGSKSFRNLLFVFYPPLLSFLRIGYFGPGLTNYFYNVFKDTVEYRIANNVVRKDFLQLLMQLMKRGYVDADEGEEPSHISGDVNGKITMIEGTAQAFAFWVAGFETSSTTATHCLFEMAVNEGVQERVAEEIDTVLKEFGGLTYECIMEMPYLHKVVSETLRKYPPLTVLRRECTQKVDLPDTGLRVEKGTGIAIPVLGLHWDPEIYPEPEKFDPERFSQENIASRHRYAYLPFGEGPRNCIGLRFGLMQTKVALITLLSRYHFSLGPDAKVPLPLDRGKLIHSSAGPVILRLKKRSRRNENS